MSGRARMAAHYSWGDERSEKGHRLYCEHTTYIKYNRFENEPAPRLWPWTYSSHTCCATPYAPHQPSSCSPVESRSTWRPCIRHIETCGIYSCGPLKGSVHHHTYLLHGDLGAVEHAGFVHIVPSVQTGSAANILVQRKLFAPPLARLRATT